MTAELASALPQPGPRGIPHDALIEARQGEWRLLAQLRREARMSVPEWRDDGSGPTAQWLARGLPL